MYAAHLLESQTEPLGEQLSHPAETGAGSVAVHLAGGRDLRALIRDRAGGAAGPDQS
jgi:hypothetical protein